MQKILNTLMLILIMFSFLFSFYLLSKNGEIQKSSEILWITETSLRNCEWETDAKLRAECSNISKKILWD